MAIVPDAQLIAFVAFGPVNSNSIAMLQLAAQQIQAARSLGEIAGHLGFRERHAAQRRAHHRAHAVTVFLPRRDLRVGQRQTRAGHRQLRKAIEPLGPLGVQVILRPEIGNLGGHVTAERRRIEPREGPHRGGAGLKAAP